MTTDVNAKNSKVVQSTTITALCDLKLITEPTLAVCDEDSLRTEAGTLTTVPNGVFEKTPSSMPPRDVTTDVCPKITEFTTSENALVNAIIDYEVSIAFNGWLEDQISTACSDYRNSLD